MGSSSTKKRITPFTPTIPARKSRTRTTLADPIPPQVAIMLLPNRNVDGVVHTTIVQLKPPPQAAVLQYPSTHGLVPKPNRRNCGCLVCHWQLVVPALLGIVPIVLSIEHVWSPTPSFRYGRTRHVRKQIVQLCTCVNWHEQAFCCGLGIIL